MESQKKSIIKKTGELFSRYGFKSVTMDDIAREVGISKKTLYKHFDSKIDLIDKLLEDSKNELANRVKIIEKEKCGLEKLYYIFMELVQLSNQSNNMAIYWSFKKYYRELFDDFMNYIGVLVDDICETAIKEAQWDGFVIPNVEAKFFIEVLRTLLVKFLDESSIQIDHDNRIVTQKELVFYNLRSIVTASGIEMLNKINDDYQ